MHPNTNNNPSALRHLSLAIILALPVLSASPLARAAGDDVRKFDIPAQPLADAVNAFIATSDWQVGFPADLARDVRANPVYGNYTPQQALDRLVAGKGLAVKQTGGSVTLVKTAAPVTVATAQSAVTLPQVTVTATNEGYDAEWDTSPYNTNYNRSNSTTSTKLDVPILDTPTAVQVIPLKLFEDRKLQNVEEFLENVSSVQPFLSFPGSTGYQIRGFWEAGDRLYNGFRESLVPKDIANIERVEVMKGPAATLYGGNITGGGMVNIITKKPLSEPYYSADFTGGSYDFYRARIDATGPLTQDKSLLYRVNASYQNNASFRDNVSNESGFFSSSLEWKPTTNDKLKFDFEYKLARYDFDVGLPLSDFQKYYSKIPISRSFVEPGSEKTNEDGYRISYDFEHKFNDDWKLRHAFFTSQYDHDIGAGRLYSTSVAEINGQPPTVNRTVARGPQYQQNYVLQNELYGKFSSWGIKHNFLAGVELFRSRYDYNNYAADLDPIDLFNPVYGVSGLSPFRFNFNGFTQVDDLGIYIQDLIEIMPKVKLLASGRYDFMHSSNAFNSSANSVHDDTFSPRVGLVYQPLASTTLYGNWGNSFSPNAFGGKFGGGAFGPTESEQFEVGVKQDFFDGKLSATLAAYHITRCNVTTSDPVNQGFQVAVGEQRSQGIEFDLAGEPLPGWNLITTYAYTDAIVTKDNAIESGKHLPNVPLHSASLWSTYELQVGMLKGLGAGFGAYYSGDRNASLFENFQFDEFVRFDASVFYRMKNVEFAVNMKNLNDIKNYISDGFNVMPSAPLTVLGTIKVTY